MKYDIVEFVVGKRAPQPFWPSARIDGGKMSQDAEGAVIIALYINRPTHSEMRNLNRPIAVRYISNDDGCFLCLLGFGETRQLIFDLQQDPTLYPAEEMKTRLAAWGVANLWSIIIINSASGILLRHQAAAAPEELLLELSKSMNKAAQTKNFSEHYRVFMERCNRKPLKDLWGEAAPAGTFGKELVMKWIK